MEPSTPSLRRSWPRACAGLTRLALEHGLRRYWERRAPSLVGRPMRHQLLALPVFVDEGTAALARAAWYGLSRAMHHYTYELPATAAELGGWLNDTDTVKALKRETAGGRRHLRREPLSATELHGEGQRLMDALLHLEKCNEDFRDSSTATDADQGTVRVELGR